MRPLLLLLALSTAAFAQELPFENLLDGGLEHWESLGDGHWNLRSDGVLIGYRHPEVPAMAGDAGADKQTLRGWRLNQSWLYTKQDYTNFDLRLDFWLPNPGNSGIALRDPTRGAAGRTTPPNFRKTPSKVAYEIQLASDWPDPWPTGSVYGLAKANPDAIRKGEWNTLHIEARADTITVRLNGTQVAKAACPPERPKSGPIGLQLHDQFSVVMFRNILVRESP